MSVTLLAFAGALLFSGDAPTDGAKKELDRLQGAWRLVAVEEGGNKHDVAPADAPVLPIKGDRLLDVPYEGKKLQMLIELDPARKPKEIILTYISPDGKERGDVLWGIYSLDGDDLRICMQFKLKGARPKEFITVQRWFPDCR